MHKLLILFLFIVSLLSFSAQPRAQDCTNPDDVLGAMVYNYTYGVFQGCTPTGWQAFHVPVCPDGDECGPTNCDTIGQQCDDDSFYIGLSPADGERVYMTAAAHETSIRWDEDPPCYRCGLGDTGATSITDGRANVEALRAYSGDNATAGNLDGFGAAKYCDGLNAIEAHGYDDWYLPAGGTGTGTEQNLFWAMVQAEGVIDGIGSTSSYYWSSSESSSSNARIQRFSDGFQPNFLKNFTSRVRCVRR